MKVILLTDVTKVGRKGDVKNVPNGYALNFLIPSKMARFVSPTDVAALTQTQERSKEAEKQHHDALTSALKMLSGTHITLAAKANKEGHLFAAVHAADIAAAIKKEHGIDVPEGVLTITGPIKTMGEHSASLSFGETTETLRVLVEKKD